MPPSSIPFLSVVVDDKFLILLQGNKNFPTCNSRVEIDQAQLFTASSAVDTANTVDGLRRVLNLVKGDKAEVSLGLGHRDLILRTFDAPRMSINELNKGIGFEIKKYIPFDLDELYYAMITMPIDDPNEKIMRVLFYGVRRQVVDGYRNLLQQAGMTMIRCEPAVSGLVRLMISRRDIRQTDKLALLDASGLRAVIYFIDGGVVKLIREFPIPIIKDLLNEELTATQEAKSRFLNEIHNSFNFYTRQFSERVTELVVVSDDLWFDAIKNLAPSMDVDCRAYAFSYVNGIQTLTGFGMGAALGLATVAATPEATINFLAPHKVVNKLFFSALLKIPTDVKPYLPLARVALGLLVLMLGLGGALHVAQEGFKKQLTLLATQQKEFAGTSIEDIQGKINKAQDDLKNIAQVSFKSQQHVVVLSIAAHMPQGMWLQDISIAYAGEQDDMVVNIHAAIYTADINQRTKAVNTFMADLRNDKALVKFVSNWQLKSIKHQQVKGVDVTVFELNGR